jgi:carboxyl-terminal processing protease
MEMLTRAMEMVRQNYVDESKITYEELVEGALEGMLRRLDPHCEYMGKSLFEDMQREQSDTSEGIGITIALRQNQLTIITVREDGPAAAGRAGGRSARAHQRRADGFRRRGGGDAASQGQSG